MANGLSFKEKRELQAAIAGANKQLAGSPSFSEKRAAQKAKADALKRLLGVGVAPAPEVAESPEIKTLREIVAGAFDSLGLADLLKKIEDAVNALTSTQSLSGDAEAVAEQALVHWATVEEAEALPA